MDMLVLAGGFGTRLRDAVSDVPKPMAPVNGMPLLELQIEHWIRQGQRSFIFLLHHQSEIMVTFLSQCSRYYGDKVSINWIIEDVPMGTGGAVANAIRVYGITGSVLVTNADTWLDGGIKEVMNNNHSSVIGVSKVPDTNRYGSISLNCEDMVVNFAEKKISSKNLCPGFINAGLYKLPVTSVLGIEATEFSLEIEVLSKLSEESRLFAEHLEGSFFDIGVPDDYFKFCAWHGQRD